MELVFFVKLFHSIWKIINMKVSESGFIFLIGTYSLGTDSKGVYSLQLNTQSGTFLQPELVVETDNPSCLLYQASSEILYTVNELERGSVSVFKHQNKQFTLLQKVDVEGKYPCHLNLVNNNKHLGVANYASGDVSFFSRESSGKLDDKSLLKVNHTGTSANLQRQEAPHAHWVGVTDNEHIYSVDLGADKVFTYQIDGAGQCDKIETAIQLTPGDGPRHIEKHPSKNIIYLVNELSNKVSVLSQQSDGKFCEKQRIDLLPSDNKEHSQAAAIKLDKTANYLYVTNRGDNSITTYSVQEDGNLKRVSNISSQGIWPRDLVVTDDNQFILVANEHSSSINLFRIDQNTGEPIATDQSVTISSPTNIILFS